MNIAVLGTGSVGQAIAGKLEALSHKVYMGTRDVQESLKKTDADGWGNPGIGTWIKHHPAIELLSFKEAVSNGSDLVVFAMNGRAAFECLEAVGKELLSNKVMLDISNPLDFSKGFPPSLFVCNEQSLAEQIQEKYPGLKVVKSLNTMSNAVMIEPRILKGDHCVFMSGDDEGAKQKVMGLLESFGWQQGNIVDLGDLSTARGTEMILPLWVRLYGKLKTPLFNFSIQMNKNEENAVM